MIRSLLFLFFSYNKRFSRKKHDNHKDTATTKNRNIRTAVIVTNIVKKPPLSHSGGFA